MVDRKWPLILRIDPVVCTNDKDRKDPLTDSNYSVRISYQVLQVMCAVHLNVQ